MAEGNAITIDMDENSEMRSDAWAQANLAVQKFETEKDIAKYIKNFFDGKYSPGWHCIVGKSFNCAAMYEGGAWVSRRLWSAAPLCVYLNRVWLRS